ncbi:hypothetical protein ACTFIW_001775 [Dictyostelium discoideum]
MSYTVNNNIHDALNSIDTIVNNNNNNNNNNNKNNNNNNTGSSEVNNQRIRVLAENGAYTKALLDVAPDIQFPMTTISFLPMSSQVQHQKFLFVAQSILTDRLSSHTSYEKFGSDIFLGTSNANSMRNHFKDQYNIGTTSISSEEIPYMEGDQLETSAIDCYKFKKLDEYCPKLFDDKIWSSYVYFEYNGILLKRSVRYTSIVFKYNHRNAFVTCDFSTEKLNHVGDKTYKTA